MVGDEPPLTGREVANLNQSIRDLTGALERVRGDFEATFVRKDVFGLAMEGVNEKVDSAQEGVERNDDRWSKLAWFVGFTALGAVLALVFTNGGATPWG